ncbi:MAG: tetratricopeptide repeat protein [Candidatus Neomarinimicrobiota bacterium]
MRKKLWWAVCGGVAILVSAGCESQEFVSAKMYVQQENLESAEQFFLQALEVESEKGNAAIPFLLARDVYSKQHKYEQMNAMLEEALSRNPEQGLDGRSITQQVQDLRQREWSSVYQRAAHQYNAVIQVTGGAPLDEQQRETVLKAKAQFETAVLIWPDEPSAFVSLIFCYRQLQDTEGEVAAVESALLNDPDNGTVLLLAGELAWKQNKREEALGLYQQAHEAMPEDINSLQRLTGVYLETGDRKAALETLERTARQAPKDPDVYYNLGAVYANIGNDALARGQTLYREAVGMEEVPLEKLTQAEEEFKEARLAYSEALYFMDNTLALNPEDDSADQAITEIQNTKKILIALQRSTEGLLEAGD